MNKRTIGFVVLCIVLLVGLTGALLREGAGQADAGHTVSESSAPAEEGEQTLSEKDMQTLSENDPEIVPGSGEQSSVLLENDEEDEYANLAIADVTNYVNVRSGPNTDSEIVGKMYDGSVAQILSKAGDNGEWFQVVSGSVEGYIKAEYFLYGESAAAVIEEYVTRYAEVRVERLNVREEADIQAKRIGYVNSGETLKLLEDCGEWLRVQYTDRKEGYVAAEYVTLREEFTYARSIEEERAEREAKRALEERKKKEEQEILSPAAPGQPGTEGGAAQTAENAANYGENIVPPDTSHANSDELRASIVAYAMQYLGNVYVHGGRSLAGGTDCSGFTCYIYADFGYSLSRTPSGQYASAGRSIDYSEIKPGDIICYTSNGKKCTHVGLYIGNGQIIHAANSRKGVIVSDAGYSTIMGIKNVID